MLADQFTGMNLRFFNHAVRFRLGVRQDSVLVGNNLLVTLNLVRRLHPKLPKKLVHLVFIHDNLRSGQRLELTTVNILFDFLNNLFNTAAH